jgi:hypothetical protein
LFAALLALGNCTVSIFAEAREEWTAKVDQFEDNNKEFDEQTVEIKNEYDRKILFKLEQLSSQVKRLCAEKALQLEVQCEKN